MSVLELVLCMASVRWTIVLCPPTEPTASRCYSVERVYSLFYIRRVCDLLRKFIWSILSRIYTDVDIFVMKAIFNISCAFNNSI